VQRQQARPEREIHVGERGDGERREHGGAVVGADLSEVCADVGERVNGGMGCGRKGTKVSGSGSKRMSMSVGICG
jgi:hypothetical protein